MHTLQRIECLETLIPLWKEINERLGIIIPTIYTRDFDRTKDIAAEECADGCVADNKRKKLLWLLLPSQIPSIEITLHSIDASPDTEILQTLRLWKNETGKLHGNISTSNDPAGKDLTIISHETLIGYLEQFASVFRQKEKPS